MSQITEARNEAIVLEAFDTLFNKRDYGAAERFWSPNYVQHSAHIEPGRDGLFNLIKTMPPQFKHEHEQVVADGELVIVHSRFSGFGQAKNWVVADFVRVVDGLLVEHWDVVEDEASEAESKSGRPMFGDRFPAQGLLTSTDTHQTAPTQFVEAAGIRFAYRRFGRKGGVPLLFFMHFTGTMDHWDPAVTDGFAQDREVILFNNAGVSSSSGEVPASIEEMARHAAAFVDALGIKTLDALGFSMGGLIAQQFTTDRPDLVRRLILVGAGPRSGEGMASLTPEAQRIFGAKYSPADELWLRVFFTPSTQSQAAGRKYLERQRARTEDRDPLPNDKVAPAQIAALQKWGAPANDPYAYLKTITQPVLVVNGSHDVIIYTVNSFILQQNLPNAQLILYPDANHGSQYQYPELFVAHATLFLNA